MKHENWAYKYGPPPEDGWPASWLTLAFVVVGPLVYFGPESRALEAWLFAAYRTIESWILPFRDWLLGYERLNRSCSFAASERPILKAAYCEIPA
jgi:hypothetical protein